MKGSPEQHVFLIYSPQQCNVMGDGVAKAGSYQLSTPLKDFFFSRFYEKSRWFELIQKSA